MLLRFGLFSLFFFVIVSGDLDFHVERISHPVGLGKLLEDGCADALCFRCKQGYLSIREYPGEGSTGQYWNIGKDLRRRGYHHVRRWRIGGHRTRENKMPGHWRRWGRRCVLTCPEGFMALRRVNRRYMPALAFFKTSSCVRRCPRGYSPSEDRKECLEIQRGCTDPMCNRCKKGFKKLIQNGGKRSCVKFCPFPHGYNKDNNTCIKCLDPACRQCNGDGKQCRRCKFGFIVLPGGENGTECVTRCPNNYRLHFGIPFFSAFCKKIKETVVIPDGCEDATCLECKDDFFKFVSSIGSSCVKECPAGHGSMGKLCTPCMTYGCASCKTNVAICDKCRANFTAYRPRDSTISYCLTKCPEGMEAVLKDGESVCNSIPKKNCTVQHCKECPNTDDLFDQHRCVRCQDNFFLSRNHFEDRCLLRCPVGYFEGLIPGTNITACRECKIPFCRSCLSAKKCIRCLPPMVLSQKTGFCEM